MGEYKLKAVVRGQKPADGKNYIAAEVYGPGTDNNHVWIERVAFEKLFVQTSRSKLIDLQIDGEESIPVIVKDLQRDVLKDNIIHIDFYKVQMNKLITAQVRIKTVGKSVAVNTLGGILVKNIDKLIIECLPIDLIGEVDIDLAKLEELGQSIRVEDLKLSDKITIKNDPREVIYAVIAPRMSKADKEAEEEIEAEAEANKEAVEGETKATEGEASPAKEETKSEKK